jgi:hypothetical protein
VVVKVGAVRGRGAARRRWGSGEGKCDERGQEAKGEDEGKVATGRDRKQVAL